LGLKTSRELDYQTPGFKEWLGKYNLLRGIYGTKETDIQFVVRAYTNFIREMTYHHPTDIAKVSDIVKAGNRGDALALNKVFVAMLRVNDISARVLYGRLAQSKKKGEMVTWIGGSSTVENDQIHAMSQFYLENVGWVPLDVSMDVKNMNPKWDNANPALTHFGNEKGQFMAWMQDKQLVDLPAFGPRSDLNPCDFTMYFDYKKLSSDWVVSEM